MNTSVMKSVFAPPYRLLPHAVFVYFVVCFLLHPLSPIYTGQLADPDDYMRLNEVINWLQGQGWYDLSHSRLGAGTVVHWARLVDLPIAFITLPFIKFFGITNAALLASFVIPLVLFTALLWLAPALARPLAGDKRANLAAILVLFAPLLLFNFTPGRVDHHGWQILVTGFGLVCLEKIITDAKSGRYAVAAGLSFACGLWIGAEALPWLVLFVACLAFFAARQGAHISRNAVVFGAALALFTAAALPLALPRAEWPSRALSWFSSADVIFAALTGAVFILHELLALALGNSPPKKQPFHRFLRLALMFALGAFAAVLFIYLVPDALVGPFADYDNFNATIALDNIGEARPLWHAFWIDRQNSLTVARAAMAFEHLILLPLVALLTVFYALKTTTRRERSAWIIQGVFLTAALLLTLFWQVRVGYFMELFAIAPLVWLLGKGWAKTGRALKGRPRFWAEIGVFAALGFLPVVLLPAIFDTTAFYPDVVLFPAARSENSCALRSVTEYLAAHYHDYPHTIMSGMNEGPELLFRTPHKVIGANFNAAGNPDVFAFFNARNDEKPRKILRKWRANLVLTCRNIAPFLAGIDHPVFGTSVFLRPGRDGKLHVTSSPSHPALLERLVNGPAPSWLKPVTIPGNTDYLLFEVRR